MKFFLMIVFASLINFVSPAQDVKSQVSDSFDFNGKRTDEVNYFVMKSVFNNYDFDGKIISKDILKMFLVWTPANLANNQYDKITCKKFEVSFGDSTISTIPSLKDWTYEYNINEQGLDEKGQVLGIDHGKFNNLKDSNGKGFPQGKDYLVYNTFIDFHSFCNVFAEPSINGNSIGNLKNIGDKIIHYSANSKPDVNLGKSIEKGSYFKNGEVTLELLGLGVVNNKTCAIVNFDSGESSFKMTMTPMPNTKIVTNGGSHYKGEIYIDLKTNWVQKVAMDEFVVTQTNLPFPPNTINSVVERNSTIMNLTKEEFEKELD